MCRKHGKKQQMWFSKLRNAFGFLECITNTVKTFRMQYRAKQLLFRQRIHVSVSRLTKKKWVRVIFRSSWQIAVFSMPFAWFEIISSREIPSCLLFDLQFAEWIWLLFKIMFWWWLGHVRNAISITLHWSGLRHRSCSV